MSAAAAPGSVPTALVRSSRVENAQTKLSKRLNWVAEAALRFEVALFPVDRFLVVRAARGAWGCRANAMQRVCVRGPKGPRLGKRGRAPAPLPSPQPPPAPPWWWGAERLAVPACRRHSAQSRSARGDAGVSAAWEWFAGSWRTVGQTKVDRRHRRRRPGPAACRPPPGAGLDAGGGGRPRGAASGIAGIRLCGAVSSGKLPSRLVHPASPASPVPSRKFLLQYRSAL
jgi:hypothetical protein